MRGLLALSFSLASVACAHGTNVVLLANHPEPLSRPTAQPGDALLPWPVTLTAGQIGDAKACKAHELAAQRYPESMTVSAIPTAFAAKTPCDQAVLAEGCAEHVKEGENPGAACLDAYRAAITANPALAFVDDLPGGYFGMVQLVAPPPAASHALRKLTLSYTWSGLGKPVSWTLSFDDAKGIDVVGATAKSGPGAGAGAGRAEIAALGASLGNFLPVAAPIAAVNCYDNYPEWKASITYDDGTVLSLDTDGSNLLGLGGPWQLTIDKQTYFQLAPDFTRSVGALIKALDLPLGETAAMSCHGFDLGAAALGK